MKYKDLHILENNNNNIILYDSNYCILILYSYTSKIAEYNEIKKELILTSRYNYSATTLKHLNKFIDNYTCYNSSDLTKLIKEGRVEIEL